MLWEDLLPRNAAFAALESEIGGQGVTAAIEQLCQFLSRNILRHLRIFSFFVFEVFT
jgi:hypothetical protein